MVKVSVNRFASTRVEAIRNFVEADIRRLQKRTISRLEEVFNVAAKMARGRIGHQRVNGKMTAIGLVQRKRWFRVAEHLLLLSKQVNNFSLLMARLIQVGTLRALHALNRSVGLSLYSKKTTSGLGRIQIPIFEDVLNSLLGSTEFKTFIGFLSAIITAALGKIAYDMIKAPKLVSYVPRNSEPAV